MSKRAFTAQHLAVACEDLVSSSLEKLVRGYTARTLSDAAKLRLMAR
jgi:hypothetical protein